MNFTSLNRTKTHRGWRTIYPLKYDIAQGIQGRSNELQESQ